MTDVTGGSGGIEDVPADDLPPDAAEEAAQELQQAIQEGPAGQEQ